MNELLFLLLSHNLYVISSPTIYNCVFCIIFDCVVRDNKLQATKKKKERKVNDLNKVKRDREILNQREKRQLKKKNFHRRKEKIHSA